MTTLPLPLPQLELHTSDLTANCLRAVKLRHEGKFTPEATEALYRGLLAGQVLEDYHAGGEVNVAVSAKILDKRLADEGRPKSKAVIDKMEAMEAEVDDICRQYVERMAPIFDGARIIGCELPIRLELDGLPPFASHLDLLFRTKEGVLNLWDWKWRDEAPTFDYLRRNMQLAMYALACAHGSVLVDGEWVEFAEWPLVSWCDLTALRVYKKSGKHGKAGEQRPMDKIVRTVMHGPNDEAAIVAEYAMRAAMAEADLWPTNPSPIGCFCCESVQFCPAFAGGVSHGCE